MAGQSCSRALIVEGLVRMFERMNITVVAEGIETLEEYETLRNMGIRYIQGYLLARPGFKVLPLYNVPELIGIRQTA